MLIGSGNRVRLQFGKADGTPQYKRVGDFYLYLGQTLDVREEGRAAYRPRTIRYAYRIAESQNFDGPCLIRWEYNARAVLESKHPRHHVQIAARLRCSTTEFDLEELHLPTGWITVEEVIRFLIADLNVKPKSTNWDEILQESEELFKQWTAMRI